MNTKKIDYRRYAEEYGLSFDEMYHQKLGGVSWESLAVGVNKGTLQTMMRDFCRDNGYDYEILKIRGAGIVSDAKAVDRGKIRALRKAGWRLKEIAVDCHCTEECVKVVLNEM